MILNTKTMHTSFWRNFPARAKQMSAKVLIVGKKKRRPLRSSVKYPRLATDTEVNNCYLISAWMSCIITRKSRASIRGKFPYCQPYMRHFSHRRKYTACSSRDSFAYSESCHDSYPQFPRSSLGTRGLQTRSHRQKKETTACLESLSAKASSTKKPLCT